MHCSGFHGPLEKNTKTVIIIPARFSSQRFPGKPLIPLLGKPMILWVAELAAQAQGIPSVYVATENKKIQNLVEKNGFQAILTSKKALTGTDRLAEAAKKISADVYLNVQGDEPMVRPSDIVKVRQTKAKYMDSIVNAYAWMGKNENPSDKNVPKVITNEEDEMVYMSRVALPGFKNDLLRPKRYKKQVCIYAFTQKELFWFRNFGRKSRLESHEDIEILRFLESGKKIRMVETESGSLAVDTPADIPKVERALLKKRNERTESSGA